MKTIKPQRLALLTRPYEYEGRFYLSICASAFFRFDQPQHLLSEVSMWKFIASALGKEAVLDMGMPKPQGEFLIYGKCHAPQGTSVRQATVSIRVGACKKSLFVAGNRRWQTQNGFTSISDAEPFSEMEISYAQAFGGAAFPQNPLGKGMPPIDGDMPYDLPNIMAPDQPITSRDERPLPAGFGAIDFTWPQRFSKIGTYDEQWLKTAFPGLATDTDWSAFNAAPEDQRLPAYFVGDESFEIIGMHPQKPVVQGTLPRCAARCFVTQKQAEGDVLSEVAMRAETLLLFPGAERGILMFRGVIEVLSDDAADICDIMVGAENLGIPKSPEHYRNLLAIRLDRKKGALHALIDGPLMPPPVPLPEGIVIAEDVCAMTPLVTHKGLHAQNIRRKAEKALTDTKEKLQTLRAELIQTQRDHGLPPPDLSHIDRALATTLPPPAVAPTLEDLPAFKEEMDQLSGKLIAEAKVQKIAAEKKVQEVCQQNNLDYATLVAEGKLQGGGPPAPVSSQVRQRLETIQADLKKRGITDPTVEAKLSDPVLAERMRKGDAMMMQSYKNYAQFYPPAAYVNASPASTLKITLGEAYRRGDSFAGRDLTAADLSGMDWRNANFSDALLEGVNFAGANLSGANFSGAVLARAKLNNSNMSQAQFVGANLGAADLTACSAPGADFTKAKMADANLTLADLSNTNLTDCDLLSVRLHGTNLSGVKAAGAKFLQVNFNPSPDGLMGEGIDKAMDENMPEFDMRGIRFAGADLTKALFLQCQMDETDFRGACLDKAVFLSANGKQVNFSGASLKNFCVVKDSVLEEANFSLANLQRANLRGTQLRTANFANADLSEADLSETILTDANLTRVQGKAVRLVKADLSQADMSGANLLQANLQKATLHGTLLETSNLFMADLLRVQINKQTNFNQANLQLTLLKNLKKNDQN